MIPRHFQKLLKELENNSIIVLDLYWKELTLAQIQQLAIPISKNKSLTSLFLNHNNINDDGAAVISIAIYKNKTLVILDLTNNNIGPVGITKIAQALVSNYTILKIDADINNTNITSYLDRNIKIFNNALHKAFVYFNSLDNPISTAETKPIHPITTNDLHTLLGHTQEIKEKFLLRYMAEIKEQPLKEKKFDDQYTKFLNELNDYTMKNFWQLKGVCKKLAPNNDNLLHPIFPEEIWFEIFSYLDMREELANTFYVKAIGTNYSMFEDACVIS